MDRAARTRPRAAALLVVAVLGLGSALVWVARPSTADGLAVGAQFHATWDGYTREQRATVLRELGDAGLTTVRIDVSWARVQPDGPGPLDEAVSSASTRSSTSRWPPAWTCW